MFKIEVKKAAVVKEVTRKTDGQKFQIPEQEAWAHLPGSDYPVRIVLGLERGHQGYPLGFYRLMPESIYVDRNSQLQVKRAPILESMTEGLQAKPRAAA